MMRKRIVILLTKIIKLITLTLMPESLLMLSLLIALLKEVIEISKSNASFNELSRLNTELLMKYFDLRQIFLIVCSDLSDTCQRDIGHCNVQGLMGGMCRKTCGFCENSDNGMSLCQLRTCLSYLLYEGR